MLITGEVVEFGGDALDSPGYDLLALINGSEGLLAVITEITVKLTPKPQHAQVALAAFDDVVQAGAAVSAVIAAGIVPAGLEMMDQPATRAVEDFVHANYPLDAKAVLLVETDGTPEEVAADMAEIRRVLTDAGATEVRVSKDEAQRQLFWSGRKAAFPAIGRITPDYYCMDGTIPRKTLARVLARIEELSKQFGLRCANVFHAGDGNLHPLILFDANVEGEVARTEAFGAAILELCIEVGGTITGEHGVGVEKLPGMCVQFRAGRARALSRHQGGVRRAFAAQSRQGRADAAPLRRVRQDARAPGPAPASRNPAILTKPGHDHPCRASTVARPDARAVADLVTRLADDYGDARRHFARDPRPAQPRRRTGRRGAARRRGVPAHERGSRGDRAPVPRGARAGHRVRRGHVARRPRRGALRRRLPRPVADG